MAMVIDASASVVKNSTEHLVLPISSHKPAFRRNAHLRGMRWHFKRRIDRRDVRLGGSRIRTLD